MVCLILGSFYAIGLTLTGLNFGLLIGLITGLISFIPYVGSLTGFLVAVGVAIAQFWPDWTLDRCWCSASSLVGQFLEGYVLSPKLVGAKVGLHPVWLMFALFAFGYLFGFVGLLIAVPLAAAIGVLAALRAAPISREPALHRRGAALNHAGPGADPSIGQASAAQLALALDHAESFAREDFLAGPSNAAALALIERWPDWPARIVLLVGPEGSGKSHLAAIWARAAGARILSRARARRQPSLPAALATGALVLEDLAEGRFDEARAVPSAQPRARGARLSCCITARSAPATLADRRAPISPRGCARCRSVALTAPDDALLRAVIVKLFADRQLAVDESLVAYLATRIERSFAAARAAVEALDREALRLQAAGHPGAGRGAVPRALTRPPDRGGHVIGRVTNDGHHGPSYICHGHHGRSRTSYCFERGNGSARGRGSGRARQPHPRSTWPPARSASSTGNCPGCTSIAACWRRPRTPSIRCSSRSASCRSRPTISTNSSWSASPA